MKLVILILACISLALSACGKGEGASGSVPSKPSEADLAALAAAKQTAAEVKAAAETLADAKKPFLAIGYDAIDQMKTCLEYNDFMGDEYIWFTNTDERTYKPVKAPHKFTYEGKDVSKEYWWILINRKNQKTELFVKEATLTAGPSMDAASRLFFLEWGTSVSNFFQMYNLETKKKLVFSSICLLDRTFYVNDNKKLLAFGVAAEKDSAKQPEVDSASMQVGIRVVDFDGNVVDTFFSGTDGVLYGLEGFTDALKYRKITVGAGENAVELSKVY